MKLSYAERLTLAQVRSLESECAEYVAALRIAIATLEHYQNGSKTGIASQAIAKCKAALGER